MAVSLETLSRRTLATSPMTSGSPSRCIPPNVTDVEGTTERLFRDAILATSSSARIALKETKMASTLRISMFWTGPQSQWSVASARLQLPARLLLARPIQRHLQSEPRSTFPFISTSDYADSLTSRTASRISSRIPKEKGHTEQPTIDTEGFRRRQQFDESEDIDVTPGKSKRNYDFGDEDDGMPKKSRLGQQGHLAYRHEEYSDDEGQEVEDNVRFGHERLRPRDPRDVGDFKRPSYGYGRGNGGQESAAYEPSTGIRRRPFEYSAPSRPSSQTGRAQRMTYEEAIAAAWEHQQEKKRQAAAEEEARQREREEAALQNPTIQQLLKDGKEAEAQEVIQMANALMDMSRDEKQGDSMH